MKNKNKTNEVSHLNTLADNLKYFSQKQKAQAKRVTELHHTLGMLSANNLKT